MNNEIDLLIENIKKNKTRYWGYLREIVLKYHKLGLSINNDNFAKLVGIDDQFEKIPDPNSNEIYSEKYFNSQILEGEILAKKSYSEVIRLLDSLSTENK